MALFVLAVERVRVAQATTRLGLFEHGHTERVRPRPRPTGPWATVPRPHAECARDAHRSPGPGAPRPRAFDRATRRAGHLAVSSRGSPRPSSVSTVTHQNRGMGGPPVTKMAPDRVPSAQRTRALDVGRESPNTGCGLVVEWAGFSSKDGVTDVGIGRSSVSESGSIVGLQTIRTRRTDRLNSVCA